MANTAEVINFPVPVVAQQELRVADLDDGFTRIANELLEAVMLAGLSRHQLLVFMAVMRKTYGFNKKSDWVSNEQISELTGILPHKCSAAKSALVKRGILTQNGRVIGINKTVSEWSSLPEKGKENKPYPKKVNLPESGKKSLPESGNAHYPNQVNTKDNITKDNKNIKRSSSKNSREFTDDRLKEFLSAHPDAEIYTPSGARWGTADDLKTAKWIAARVRAINPACKKPDITAWSNTVRLIRQLDGRTHQEICALYDWASKDSFWHKNILCPATLRKQWDRLILERGSGAGTTGRPKTDLSNTDWIYGVLE